MEMAAAIRGLQQALTGSTQGPQGTIENEINVYLDSSKIYQQMQKRELREMNRQGYGAYEGIR